MNRHRSHRDASSGPVASVDSGHITRIVLRMLAAVAIVGGSASASALIDSAPAFAQSWDCGTGVTVVVDFTDLGGTVQAGCAEGDQETGRAALISAGFTATDSQPGLLCAINSMPDPCPETFQGSYWSYWHGDATAGWVSYQVGADSSNPARGDFEGWRYNDGTTPPSVVPTPAGVSGVVPTQSPDATATPDVAPGDGESATSTDDPLQQLRGEQNLALSATAIGFGVLVAALVVVFVMRARRRGPGTGSGNDTGSGTGSSTGTGSGNGPGTGTDTGAGNGTGSGTGH